MPSAANVKIDKQVHQENTLSDSSQNLTPFRQGITILEHKIRNLEKRKAKLETYREFQNAGKELNADQKTAVAKFSEVINTLDFARDLCKQFLGIASVSEKEAKKLAKKEASLKYQAELARLREILLVQDALNQMGNETVREDFLNGKNGAAQLSETDLKLLDDFHPTIIPKHEAGNPTTFTNAVQAAAEHLLAAVDGKPKEVFGGTYSQIKEILGKIHESGYFDQAQVFESYESEVVAEPEITPLTDPPVVTDISAQQQQQQPQQQPQHISPPQVVPAVVPHTVAHPMINNLTIEAHPLPVLHQPPTLPNTVVEIQPPSDQSANVPPVEVYYQVPPQPPRPIAEMLSGGSFFFLQESEIDPLPEQIPSQTFTNQNYSTAHAPLPVPLTPHFAPIPNMPANHQVPQLSVGNNGIGENILPSKEQIMAKDVGNQGPPRPGNNSYYQNNGYNNRPRHQTQNRSAGPRPTNTRHN